MPGNTVLVLTAPDDPTADLVVRELGRRGTAVFRADLAWFPTRLTMTARAGDQWTGVLRLPDRAVRFCDIISVYYRRPNSYAMPAFLSEDDRAWADAEARHGLGGVLTALDLLWLPDPVAAARAEFKPVQLVAAAQVGLHIPDTLVTNDPDEAADFVASQPDGAVYKPLFGRPTTHDGQPEALYTTTVAADAITPAVAHTAHMFQAKVPKAYEVRLTVVADHVFAARIDAASEMARADWRADYTALTYTVIDPPDDIADAAVALTTRLGLRYGALDFAVTPDGEWMFFEINPNGQWAWIPGLREPITHATADLLEERL